MNNIGFKKNSLNSRPMFILWVILFSGFLQSRSMINWPFLVIFLPLLLASLIWPRRSNFLTIVWHRRQSNESLDSVYIAKRSNNNNVKVKFTPQALRALFFQEINLIRLQLTGLLLDRQSRWKELYGLFSLRCLSINKKWKKNWSRSDRVSQYWRVELSSKNLRLQWFDLRRSGIVNLFVMVE